ncbi:helix-turn-helix domain-containing protein [Amycolatopsis sp. NPDC004079]|uniref:helix-turn-helix domain-containing protein n=1 Tax=Amycolatopsis sp. NPDC004079 TaxID=3154549 RepID=UPI0033BD7115
MKRKAGRGVLEGAFLLLEELARSGEAGPTQLAAATGLHKATAHRLLDQLVGVGAVQRNAGRYRVGPQLFRLGQAWEPARVLRAAVGPPLRQLAAAARRTSVSVGVPAADSGRVLIGCGIRGEADEICAMRAGWVLPSGAAAEIILTASGPHTEPPEKYSGREWRKLLAGARERGVAFDYSDGVSPLCCVAAPVRSASGEVVAAVGAVALDQRRLPSLADAVRRAANLASANLARVPSSGSARP